MIGVASLAFHETVITCTAIGSLATNGFLLYTMATTDSSSIGAYAILLACFALWDMFLAIMHYAILPVLVVYEFGYIVAGYRAFTMPTTLGQWATLVFAGSFYETYILLVQHFAYRYLIVCNPPWLQWTDGLSRLSWISIAVFLNFSYTGIYIYCCTGFSRGPQNLPVFRGAVNQSFGLDLYAPPEPGYIGVLLRITDDSGSQIMNWPSVIRLLVIIGMFVTSGAVTAFFAISIWKSLKNSTFFNDSHMRDMQKRLFRALLVQTAVPLLFSYLPVSSIFIFPMIGVPIGGAGDALLLITSLFPLIDPILILVFLPLYEDSLSVEEIKDIFRYHDSAAQNLRRLACVFESNVIKVSSVSTQSLHFIAAQI